MAVMPSLQLCSVHVSHQVAHLQGMPCQQCRSRELACTGLAAVSRSRYSAQPWQAGCLVVYRQKTIASVACQLGRCNAAAAAAAYSGQQGGHACRDRLFDSSSGRACAARVRLAGRRVPYPADPAVAVSHTCPTCVGWHQYPRPGSTKRPRHPLHHLGMSRLAPRVPRVQVADVLAEAAEDRVSAMWHASLALVGALLLAEQAAASGKPCLNCGLACGCCFCAPPTALLPQDVLRAPVQSIAAGVRPGQVLCGSCAAPCPPG